MPKSEAPIISKISAPDQDISLNKQAKIATERPKFFSLSIIIFFKIFFHHGHYDQIVVEVVQLFSFDFSSF